MMRLFNNQKFGENRKFLRNDMPEPERKIWSVIRARQCEGVKFRRQCSIGPYIVDFYSFETKIVIEIDGDSHFYEGAEEYDKKRTLFLENLGIQVIRFTNLDIMQNLEGCYEVLQDVLRKRENNESE